MIISAIVMGGWKLHSLLNNAETLPIEAIAVKGERDFTSNAEIQQAMQSLMQKSFFNVDVNKVQQTLETLPWVYQASVRREWPAKFKVFLKEQQPIAHWNDTKWLNVHGDVFSALKPSKDIKRLASLPYLYGADSSAQDVLTVYRQINKLLQINGFGLTTLSFNLRHAWQVTLSNGIKLNLGREDKMARIQRFINLYPSLEKMQKPVATLDLRYDTGLAVAWESAQKRAIN